jgi:hypothetical protein
LTARQWFLGGDQLELLATTNEIRSHFAIATRLSVDVPTAKPILRLADDYRLLY